MEKVHLKTEAGSSRRGAAETNPTRNHEVVGSIPAPAQWVKDLVLLRAVVQATDAAQVWRGCGVGRWLQLEFAP